MIISRIRNFIQLLVALGAGFHAQVLAQNLPFSASGKPIDHSLRREVARTIDRGSQWLLDHQDASGFWLDSDQPCATAFALIALQRDPEEYHTALKEPAVKDGYRYLNSCIQKNGGIYTSQTRSLIDTPIAILALLMRPAELQEVTVRNARKFLAKELKRMADDEGVVDGLKFDSAGESDLLTIMHGLEALRFTQQFSEQSEGQFLESEREVMLSYIGKHQYPVSDFGSDKVAGLRTLRGGFVAHSMAEQNESTALNDATQSQVPAGIYGFAGLLSYLYLDVNLSDPRVVWTLDWLNRNYTLKQNPGIGPEEVYLYYLAMAKAWTALKILYVPPENASKQDWRHDLALHLMNLQQADGSWSNEGDTAQKSTKVLSTSYALITLEIIYPEL